MGNKFNKIIATGLLSAMIITNMSACDNIYEDNGVVSTTDVDYSIVESENYPTSGDNSNTEETKKLEGSVWDAMKSNIMPHSEFENAGDLYYMNSPIPLRFLQDMGILYYNDENNLVINGKQETYYYIPFSSRVFIDKESKNNDVYVLLQYVSDQIKQNDSNKDVWVATWKLKYNLDDKDYETLLKLENTYLARFFIQEMDNQYQPEIITESIVDYNVISIGSCLKDKHWTEKDFPNIYVSDIDYDNQIITYAVKEQRGFKFYDLDMRETNAWDKVITVDNLTEEQRENSIWMTTKPTLLGDRLTAFMVNGWTAGLSTEQAQQLYKNSTKVEKLDEYNAHSKQKYNNYITSEHYNN